MFDSLKKWVNSFTDRKDFSALNKNLLESRQTALVNEAVTRSMDLPSHIIPLKSPNEISYDSIISQVIGTIRKDKMKSLVMLPPQINDEVCVVQKDKTANILISTSMYGTTVGKSVIAQVRDQLATHALTVNVSWCLPDLVREMSHSATLNRQKNESGEERKKYDTEPNRKAFTEILRAALQVGATDVHIELKEDHGLIRFTIDTELWPWDNGRDGVVVKSVAEALIGFSFYFSLDEGSNSTGSYSYFESLNWTITETNFDNYYSVKLRMQSNAKLPDQGPDLIYRILPIGRSSKNLALPDMGYAHDQLSEFNEALLTAGGLILIAGIPNSGKTTTIKAAIEAVPNRDRKKFVIAEDPAEYVLDFASHATIQAGINDSDRADKYAAMIAGWLRGNPHVIATGEIRDGASGIASITATEVGCMTFASVHAASIIGIFDRLTEKFIGLDLKSITAEGKVKLLGYQKLMPVLCKECRIPLSEMDLDTQKNMRSIGNKLSVDVDKIFYRQIGKKDCPCCEGRGVKGMTLVAEIYAPTPEFLNHIRNEDIFAAQQEWERLSDGCLDSPNMSGKRVLHHGFYKMLQGDLDPDTVRMLGRFDSLAPKVHDVVHGERLRKVGT